MSIAVSTLIQPSRLLYLPGLFVCAGGTGIGVVIGLGLIGELPLWWRILSAAFCVLSAILGLVFTVRFKKIYHIDISGVGQIRLRTQFVSLKKNSKSPDAGYQDQGSLVSLQDDSTFWPHFLLLRLRGEDGCLYIVPILADCMSAQSFRAISVACRWIAAHRFSQ